MDCKNCKHKLEMLDKKTSFLKKYITLQNGLNHQRHRWNKFIPSRVCFCGCEKPEINQKQREV